MSIRPIAPFFGPSGALITPAGQTLSYTPDFEADLVQRGLAAYTAPPSFPGKSRPLEVIESPSSGVVGNIEFVPRPDGTFFPAVSTDFGFSPLSGFDPFHLIDGVPGEAFDHRSIVLSETIPAEVTANAGDAVKMVKGVRLPGGQIPKKNRIPESEGWDNWTKTNAQIADTADPVAVKLTTSANAGYLQSLPLTRTIGELCVFALECKSDGAEWVFIGPGGAGRWININTGETKDSSPANSYNVTRVASTDGYTWVVLSNINPWTSTAVSNMRIYPSNTAPTSGSSGLGILTGTNGVLIRRAYYGRNQSTFVPSDYNPTESTPHDYESYGNYLEQPTISARPVLSGGALAFAGGKSMVAVFAEPLGNCTIGKSRKGQPPEIVETAVGLTYPVTEDYTYICFIGRSLSAMEKQSLSDYLAARAK